MRRSRLTPPARAVASRRKNGTRSRRSTSGAFALSGLYEWPSAELLQPPPDEPPPPEPEPLFGLGPLFLERYRDIFRKLYREDRDLTIRRDTWGFFLGLIATLTLYGAYAWIALSAIATRITLGQMTMYLMLFRQGQSAVSAILSAVGGMYEDNLYLSTLYDYTQPDPAATDSPRRAVRAGVGVTATSTKPSAR